MKIELIKSPNISSVKRVKYRTKLLKEKKDDMAKSPLVHNPTHVYKGRNGRPILWENLYSTAVKAKTGPVLPMIVKGCPEDSE
mmetsp:Transcript_5921/g.8899  ORF Transcript_5921/g.8899 Transcript_5921/m.8899 type:complete len:83 (+) Transcript_5921:1050-1298(+)